MMEVLILKPIGGNYQHQQPQNQRLRGEALDAFNADADAKGAEADAIFEMVE